jgi:hypothetical protein
MSEFMVTTHVSAPLHPPPLHPVKLELVFGVALRVTVSPGENPYLHVLPQLIPAGVLVTVPFPLFESNLAIVRVLVTAAVKVAVTVLPLSMINVHVLFEPVQSPLHPEKVEPERAVAVRVTMVPEAYVAEHVAPQLIPAGELVTAPLPDLVMVSVLGLDPVLSVKKSRVV